MIPKAIEQVTPEDILALIPNQVREGKSIDYKRDMIGDADSDKIRFLADVSSFANASGGDLVLGVDEKDGVPVAVPGVELDDPDRAIARLDNMIRSGLEPRL
jgi:predicted HTH transcriptional regulator